MNNWPKLCEAIKTYTVHPKHCPFRVERTFEDHFTEYLRYIFGWEYNEVKRQYAVKFGHENKLADIVLFDNDIPVIVVELKAFGQPLAGEETGQLQSYMKQLSAKFGILTNSVALQLWYRYEDNGKESMTKVLTVRFDEKNRNGKILGKLLTRKKFSQADLADFCNELLQRQKDGVEQCKPYKANPKNVLMEEQMTYDLDEKMEQLISLYEKWIENTESEAEYGAAYKSGISWTKKNVLDEDKLKGLSDKEYEELIRDIPNHLINLKFGFTAMGICTTLKPGMLHDSHKAFNKAIRYLNSAPKENRYDIIQDLVCNPDYKIKGMGAAFWSEIIRCKYADVPLVNGKTTDFFLALGLNIGIAPKDITRNVGYCYSRWRSFHEKKISIFELSHMEHFAKEVEEGQKFMKDNFGMIIGEYEY